MTFSWDFNVAALGAILVTIIIQSISLVVYLVKTNGKAHSAHDLAKDAMERIDESDEKIAAQMAVHSLFREQVAREYVSREVLHEILDPIRDSINGLSDRIDTALDRRQK
jgi:hypothetical protein